MMPSKILTTWVNQAQKLLASLESGESENAKTTPKHQTINPKPLKILCGMYLVGLYIPSYPTDIKTRKILIIDTRMVSKIHKASQALVYSTISKRK